MFSKILKIVLLIFGLFLLNSYLTGILNDNGVTGWPVFIISILLFLVFVRVVLAVVNDH